MQGLCILLLILAGILYVAGDIRGTPPAEELLVKLLKVNLVLLAEVNQSFCK
jgi:hypothetical protein